MTKHLRNRLLILLTEKERQENRRITQKEVAEAVNTSEQTIGRWLKNDVTKFEGPLVERICDYFDCDLGDLLYFEQNES